MTAQASDNAVSADPVARASWTQERLQPPMIVLMTTAFMLGPIAVLKVVVPDGPWQFLPLAVLVVALEGALTTRWLAGAPLSLSRTAYRLAELLTIIVLLRLVTWLLPGNGPPFSFRALLLDPSLVIDGVFLAYGLTTLFAWQRVTLLTAMFNALRPDKGELAYFTMSEKERQKAGLETILLTNRSAISRGFVRSWILGGAALAFFAALATLDLSSLIPDADSIFSLRSVGRLGLQTDVLIGLLAYFLIGFWLASQSRLAVMQSRWMVDRIEVEPSASRAWRRLSAVLLLVIATVAAFLPIGSTLAISRVVQAIVAFAMLLAGLLISVASLVVYALALIFPFDPPEPQQLAPALPFELPSEDLAPGIQGGSSSLIFGGMFWLLVTMVSIAAVFFYLQQRSIQLNLGPVRSLWSSVLHWLLALLTRVIGGAATVRAAAGVRLRRLGARDVAVRAPWRFLRINALSGRDQVRYFYLSTARRAADRGVRRVGSDTPLEYAQDLQESWPEARGDVNELTEAFLKARYSRTDFEEQELGPIKSTWMRMRHLLRRQARSDRGQ